MRKLICFERRLPKICVIDGDACLVLLYFQFSKQTWNSCKHILFGSFSRYQFFCSEQIIFSFEFHKINIWVLRIHVFYWTVQSLIAKPQNPLENRFYFVFLCDTSSCTAKPSQIHKKKKATRRRLVESNLAVCLTRLMFTCWVKKKKKIRFCFVVSIISWCQCYECCVSLFLKLVAL